MPFVDTYLKGATRGEFVWEVDEAGEFGEANRIDIESTSLDGRTAKITRQDSNSFEAEVDNLKSDPVYDVKNFASRRNARSWCERLIRKDIKKEGCIND